MKQRAICLFMVVLLVVGAATPKKAYAVAGVDDAAVGIVCALLAAAGVTFASNVGVQDAVGDFLEDSGGAYDVVLRSLVATAVPFGDVLAYKVDSSILPGVRGLLEGLFDYFKTDENRQGVVVIPGGSFTLIDVNSLPTSVSGFGKDWSFGFFVPYSSNLFIAAYDGRGGFLSRSENFRFDSASSSWVCDYFDPKDGSSVRSASVSVSDPSDVAIFISFYPSIGQSFGIIEARSYRPKGKSVGYPFPNEGGKILQINDIFYYNPIRLGSGFDISTWVPAYGVPSDRSIPYGLTFPEALTAPDVIDNFEQRVEAAAGDLAIVVPVDGVVDNTFPYADAQEQYLANVNELGEVTDTVTETNSWLQQILINVKALPAAISTSVIGTGELDLSGFQGLALTSVFPFCIPFDFVNCIRYFAVPEVVPVWTVNLSGSPLAAFGTFEINFERFSVWAKIIKFFLYSIFVVGLVKLTRHLIKG